MRLLKDLTGQLKNLYRGDVKTPAVKGGRGPTIHIFVPSYPGPKVKTMEAVLNLMFGWQELGTGIRLSLKLTGGAYIDVMRNEALVAMFKDPEALGILMVDHDAIFPNKTITDPKAKKYDGYNALHQLYKQYKDIIGGLTTTRSMPIKMMCGGYTDVSSLACLDDMDKCHPLSSKPFMVEWTACHFTYISRRGAMKIVDHYGQDKHFFECGSRILLDNEKRAKIEEALAQHKAGEIDTQAFLKTMEYWVDLAGVFQEDVSFCRRARAAGCEIWIDPSFEVQHIGDYAYSRMDWLGQKMRQDEEAKEAEKAS